MSESKLKKICVVCPWGCPVPAIKGGAVETLLQFLIGENEKTPNFEFTLLTSYDERAEQIAKKYKHTKYIGFKDNKYLDKPWDFCFRAIKKFFHIYIPFAPRMLKITKYIKKEANSFDYLLLECGATYMLPIIAKVFPKERILAHLHWTGDGNPKLDSGAGYVLAVSDFVAEEWKRTTQCDIDKLFVWHNCYNNHVFNKTLLDKEKAELRKNLGIQNEQVVIYTGRIIEGKGVLELIRAMQKIHVQNVVLLMIGSSHFGKNITTQFEREICDEIKKSKVKIIQLGFVNNEELYKYFSISTIAVNPSKLEEAALIANVEAMAMGIPVITTKKGAISEYVEDKAVLLDVDNALVDNLSHRMEQLLLDGMLLREYSEKSRVQAAKFTRENYFSRFTEIVDEIEHKRSTI